jgi:hypothetical protein
MVTMLRSARPGVRFPAGTGKGFFLITTASIPAMGPTELAIHWIPGALFLGGKVAGA